MGEVETLTVSHKQGTFTVRTYGEKIPRAEITGTGLQTLSKRDLCAIIAALDRARDRMR